MMTKALAPELLNNIDACWRAANYLSVGQIYLFDKPLLKRPLQLADIKHMLLGHWGTTPGQNFIYVHLNRAIKEYDLDMIYVSGPGHGGPAVVANTYLEGTYTEIYPHISQDEAGLQKLFLQFSFPGGIPSHASPECPGSIHEGGELGYSLSHSFGAAFDNPTVLTRIGYQELEQLRRGYGWTPYLVEGHEPALMHETMAATFDTAILQIKKIQKDARENGITVRPHWPMMEIRSPGSMTCGRECFGKHG
jgi:xylulose-5-phosphate/fructose-6-phosphate phosphoketolase